MNGPDDLDRRLEELSEEPAEAGTPTADPEAEAKALERLITRRIRRICLKTLLCVALCAALLFLCINPLMKLSAFNPIKLEEDDMGFTRYLNAYFGTMGPYTVVTGATITDTGFGTYDAALGVVSTGDLFVSVGDNTAVHMSIRQGKAAVTSDPEHLTNARLGRFGGGWPPREELLPDLEKLPDSCYIRLSVGTDTPLPLSQLRDLPVDVVWAEVYNPENPFQGGVALLPMLQFGDEPDPQTMDDAELAAYFAQNLELLLSQPELVQSLGLYSGNWVSSYTKHLEEALAFARSQTVLTSQNYCIAGEKAEILAFLQETETTSLRVDHIFLSALSE